MFKSAMGKHECNTFILSCSSMNISSSCSSEDFSDEEQVLVFTWMSELTGAVGVENIITRKLKEHGFLKTKEQVGVMRK